MATNTEFYSLKHKCYTIFTIINFIVVKDNRNSYWCGFCILVSALGNCIIANAQSDTNAICNKISYSDKILIKLNASTQIDQYALRQTQGSDLILQSNNEYKCFLSLDYEFIGFSYGFAPALFGGNDDDALKGKSSYSNYRFLFFPGQWLQTAEYDRVKGFYALNTGDYIPDWKEGTDPYIQFPSLTSSRWAFSTSYIVNRNFSLKNIVYQTEWQKRSAGSFVPVIAYDVTNTYLNELGIESKQREFNIRMGCGYYYTFIIKDRFFISPNLTQYVGAKFSRGTTIDNGIAEADKDTYITHFLEGGIKIGFNSKRFVLGTGLNFNSNWYQQDASSRIYNDRVFGIVYFGYRFNQPKLLSKAYNKVKEIVPFL